MYGVIIIAHASRDANADRIIGELADMVRGLLKDAAVEYGFVRKNRSDFESIVDKFDSQGIDKIIVVPYYLFGGKHVRDIIPAIVNELEKKYPEKEITMKEPLGIDKRLAEIVADRIMR